MDDCQCSPQRRDAVPFGVQGGDDVAVRAHDEGVRIGPRDSSVEHAELTVAKQSYRHRKSLGGRRPRGESLG